MLLPLLLLAPACLRGPCTGSLESSLPPALAQGLIFGTHKKHSSDEEEQLLAEEGKH